MSEQNKPWRAQDEIERQALGRLEGLPKFDYMFQVDKDADGNFLFRHPEHAMGLQIVDISQGPYSGHLGIVLGGSVLVVCHPDAGGELNAIFRQDWLKSAIGLSIDARIGLFDRWLGSLPSFNGFKLFQSSRYNAALRFVPPGTIPPSHPASGSTVPVYGHLPFTATVTPPDIVYHYTAWPRTTRINLSTGAIAPGTYVVPQSEFRFLPTGFSVVGRLALPNVMPAIFRWELSPDPATVHCGASVPLFGQAGGGVEMCFVGGGQQTSGATLLPPTIIPAL